MALGVPPTARGNGTGTTTAAPAAFTPSANSILRATVFARQNTTVPAQPTISDTSGLTWVPIIDQQYDPGANPRSRGRSFYAVVGGSPSSTTITGACTGASNTFIIVSEYVGASTDFTNAIGATHANGDPAIALPNAPGATSGVDIHAWFGANNTIDALTGFTEQLDAQAAATSNRLYSSYDFTSPPQNASITSTNFTCIAIAVEVKEASAGGAYTLTAALGTFGLSGQAAGLRVARILASAVGSLALTGQAASLKAGRALGAAVGAFVVTGQSAGLRAARRLAGDAGAFVVAGSATGLQWARRMIANAGAYTVATSAATLRKGYGIAANAGMFALDGVAAGLRVARRLLGLTGAYSVDGQDAELIAGVAPSVPLTVAEHNLRIAPAKIRIMTSDPINRFVSAKAKTRIVST